MKKDWTLVQAVSILKMRVSRSPSAASFRLGPGSCLFRHLLTLSGIQTNALRPLHSSRGTIARIRIQDHARSRHVALSLGILYTAHSLGIFERSGLTSLHGTSTDRLSKAEQMIATPTAGVTGSMAMQTTERFTPTDTDCMMGIVSGEERTSTHRFRTSCTLNWSGGLLCSKVAR